MKKIIFTLVLLLFTAPAWAGIIIDATQVGYTNEVEISYEVTAPDVNRPRAFGLNITVSDGNIIDCIPAMVGECTASVQGFGIFPGTIVIDENGDVTDDGTPVGEVSDSPDTLPGLGTNGITVEMGSLYQEPNAPGLSGLLCTIVLDADEACTVTIAGNAARCGTGSVLGVVMENPDEVIIPTYESGPYDPPPVDCFSSAHPDYDEWVAVGKPVCWCYKYQCYGDADGKLNGDPISGYARVKMADLNILIPAWKKPVDDPDENLCADFDRTLNGDAISGFSRVKMADLNILITNWKDDSGIPMESPNCGGDIDLTL